MNRHVTHLITAYASRQLDDRQRRLVLAHVRGCEGCRAALEQEITLVGDLRAMMSGIGTPTTGQLNRVYPAIVANLRRPPLRARRLLAFPLYSMTLTVVLVVAVFFGSSLLNGPLPAMASPMAPADVKATSTPIFTGEPTQVALQAEASLTAEPRGVEWQIPISPVPPAMVVQR